MSALAKQDSRTIRSNGPGNWDCESFPHCQARQRTKELDSDLRGWFREMGKSFSNMTGLGSDLPASRRLRLKNAKDPGQGRDAANNVLAVTLNRAKSRS